MKLNKKPAPQRAGIVSGKARLRQALKLIDDDPIALALAADVIDEMARRSPISRRSVHLE